MKTKVCTGICGLQKPLSDFGKNKQGKDGYFCWCKECVNQYNKEYYEKYPWKQILQNINSRCNNPKLIITRIMAKKVLKII